VSIPGLDAAFLADGSSDSRTDDPISARTWYAQPVMDRRVGKTQEKEIMEITQRSVFRPH
jgi:hypothetical protein